MLRALLLSLLFGLAPAVAGLAQPAKPKPMPAAPCCGITAIDNKTGIVTAQEASTGHVFQFEVKDVPG